MTAYLSNLPWSAADGGELGGGRGDLPGFGRVLIYPKGGTGVLYDERAQAPDRGDGGAPMRPPKRGTKERSERWPKAKEDAMPARHGSLQRLSGSIARERNAMIHGVARKVVEPVVQVACDCGRSRYEMKRSMWVGKSPPRQCRLCYEDARSAGLIRKNSRPSMPRPPVRARGVEPQRRAS